MVSEGRRNEIRCHIWLGDFKNGELSVIIKIKVCLLTEEKQQNLESVEDNLIQFP